MQIGGQLRVTRSAFRHKFSLSFSLLHFFFSSTLFFPSYRGASRNRFELR